MTSPAPFAVSCASPVSRHPFLLSVLSPVSYKCSAEPDEFSLRIDVLFNEMNEVSSDLVMFHLNRLGALSPADMCLLPLPALSCATQTEVRRSRCSLPALLRILPH